MSDQPKQIAELKQQILEQISEEELEAAVGAKEGYATMKPDDFTLNHPLTQLNTGVRQIIPHLEVNTGVRRTFPLNINTGVRLPNRPK
jgi:hypothetical protein